MTRQWIVWPLCWTLYYVGDAASRIVNHCPSANEEQSSLLVRALVAIYMRTMQWSFRLQVWAEDGTTICLWLPWGPPAEDRRH